MFYCIQLIIIYFLYRHIIRESMSARFSSEHTRPRGTSATQSFASRLLLLFQEVVQRTSQTDKISYKAGKRASSRGSTHTPSYTRVKNFKVLRNYLNIHNSSVNTLVYFWFNHLGFIHHRNLYIFFLLICVSE